MDLWGPYKEPTIENYHYFLTVVDDYSRTTWTFLMPDKTKVFMTIKQFIALVKNQLNAQIETIRTDNGSEFVNVQCTELFQTLGIIHQQSCPYTPQRNGRVEVKHKHLLQITRALMFESYLPMKYWGYSLLYATQIINRLPTPLLD